MAPSRNFSSHSDLSQMAVGAPEPIKVQVFVKGRLEQVICCTSPLCTYSSTSKPTSDLVLPALQSQGKWSYKGGKRLFQSVPVGYGYADLMYKMCEKLASDISMKYLAPGEELSPDNLISVSDDDDVQVTCGC